MMHFRLSQNDRVVGNVDPLYLQILLTFAEARKATENRFSQKTYPHQQMIFYGFRFKMKFLGHDISQLFQSFRLA